MNKFPSGKFGIGSALKYTPVQIILLNSVYEIILSDTQLVRPAKARESVHFNNISADSQNAERAY